MLKIRIMVMKQNTLAISSFLTILISLTTLASFWSISLANTSTGISFKLHHRYSLEKSNVSHDDDRFARLLVSQSHFGARSFQDVDNDINNLSIPVVRNQFQSSPESFVYAVEVGIGTFEGSPSYQPHYLRLDPSKPIIWTQCEDCTQCFSQHEPLFPKSRSKSYNLLDCDDPRCPGAFCHRAHQNYCSYDTYYTRESVGELARETVTFLSNGQGIINNYTLSIGCGIKNHLDTNDDSNNTSVSVFSGVLALSNSNLSLVGQLNTDHGFPRRFSYCLQPFSRITTNTDDVVPMQLRIGFEMPNDDNDFKGAVMNIFNIAPYSMGILVVSMSVNQNKLEIPPSVFQDEARYSVLLDSSTAITHLIKEAYVPLKYELINVLSNYSSIRRIPGEQGLDLCYEGTLQKGEKLPNITFATLGRKANRVDGDFVVQPEAGFYQGKSQKSGKDMLCLAMVQSAYQYTIIGAYQQTNKLIIYDYEGSELLYKDQDCSLSQSI